MFHRSENNIHSDVFFEVQAPGCCTIATSLDAPTIFTGRPLRGTLLVSHEGRQDHAFDVVQLTLQGIECEIACFDSTRLIIVL